MTILRALGGLVLGLLVFAGLLYLLVAVNTVQRLDDPELYRAAFTETDAYNRTYDEVLVDIEVQDQTLDLLGGVGLETQEAIEALRDVMPPAYLQEQTEANIDRFAGFLSHDLERLELYLELKEPLDRVEAVVLDKTEQVITALHIEEPRTATTDCTADSLQSLAGDLADEFAGLSAGQLPESIPSLKTLDEDCRRQEFDNWIDRVASSPQLDADTAKIIEDEKDDLRESFIEGDTRAFLEKAAAPLVSPVIDDSLEEIRRDLQLNDRLDLLEKLAEGSDDLTREGHRRTGRVPSRCREHCRRNWKAGRSPGGNRGQLAASGSIRPESQEHAPVAGTVPVAWSRGVPRGRLRAAFCNSGPDEGRRDRFFVGHSRAPHQPGRRSLGIVRSAIHRRVHSRGCDRSGDRSGAVRSLLLRRPAPVHGARCAVRLRSGPQESEMKKGRTHGRSGNAVP